MVDQHHQVVNHNSEVPNILRMPYSICCGLVSLLWAVEAYVGLAFLFLGGQHSSPLSKFCGLQVAYNSLFASISVLPDADVGREELFKFHLLLLEEVHAQSHRGKDGHDFLFSVMVLSWNAPLDVFKERCFEVLSELRI